MTEQRKPPFDWTRFWQCQVFDESRDIFRGPRWAQALFVAAAVATGGAAVLCILAVLAGHSAAPFLLGAYVVTFLVMCGIAWHTGLRGRARNGLITAILITAILVAIQYQ